MAKGQASSNKKVVKQESETEASTSSSVNEEQIEEAGKLVEEVEVSESTEEESVAEVSAEDKAVDVEESSVSEVTGSGSDNADVDDETMRTVFIKGLDYDTTEAMLREEMEKIGPCGRVYVPMTHDDRRNKGFAYIEFKKLIDAKKALKLNDTMFLGRKVVVDQAKPKTNFMLYTVFVKNLSFDTKKEELLEYFNKFGKVHNLSLPIDLENPDRNRGFCFVEYTNEEIANKVAEGKHVVNKRNLYCDLGNKNEERNVKRSNDRLYGRRDDRRDNRRDDRRDNGRNNRRDNYRGGRNDERRGTRKSFNDDE